VKLRGAQAYCLYNEARKECVVLDEITPVLLTLNEAANISRTLSCLTWAKDIVIVDSGSADETLRGKLGGGQ
jgi:hypothetical protein